LRSLTSSDNFTPPTTGGSGQTGEHWMTPSWAENPTSHYVLEERKDSQLLQINRVDQQKCYRFGRNTRLGSDVGLKHLSISRVHAALVHGPEDTIFLFGENLLFLFFSLFFEAPDFYFF
jgi:hypothetical protein